MAKPWFRLYAEFATDPVVQHLSFDDQRHFIVLLCFKCSGLLDREFSSPQQRMDVIRKALGLDGKAWEEMRARLSAVGLIDDDLQPLNWSKRQYEQDRDPATPKKQGYIYFIGGKSGDVKIGYSRNPWARLTDIGYETKTKGLKVLATVRTESTSEISIHHLLAKLRKNGEWFAREPVIADAIGAAASGAIKTEDELIRFIRSYGSSYVADDVVIDVADDVELRTDTDTETDTESESESERSARRRAKTARASRLPDDFELTPERRRVAEAEHLDPERVFAKFCDYWRAESGARARKLDWDATWRNWCRTESDRMSGGPPRRSNYTSKRDEVMARLRAAVDPNSEDFA